MHGNKRTALVTALVIFLDLNGFVILAPQMQLYDAMIAIANEQMGKYDLAELLKELPEK